MVTVFDLYKKEHVFCSSNLGKGLGYNLNDYATNLYFETKIHPDDFLKLSQNSFSVIKLFDNFSTDEKINYKMVSEVRFFNATNQYVRIILQQQALELAPNGDLWLALCIFDLSPNQKNLDEGVKSELLNFRTGKIIPLAEENEGISASLTKREVEILKLVKEGLLSKEISDKLSISLHTVNTHRQKILEKLSVNNSMEAVIFASKLGLV